MNYSTKTCVHSSMAGAAAILIACGGVSAQTSDAAVKARQEANRKLVQQPIRYARSVRPPVIDLEAMAKERRPGQVMPGDPYVSGAMPLGARRDLEPLGLPDSGRQVAPKATRQRTDVPTLAVPKSASQQPAAGEPTAPEPTQAGPSATEFTPEPAQAAHAIVHEPQPVTAAAQAEPAPSEPTRTPRTPESSEPVTSRLVEPAPIAAAAPSPAAPSPVASIPIVSAPAPASVPAAASPAPSSAPALGIEALLVDNISAPMSTESARVSVAGLGGVMSEAQWRTADGAWRQPRAGEAFEGKIEVRAGINGEVTLVVDGQVQVTVSRLGRIVIERALEQGGSAVPTIALARGAIDIRPADGASMTGPLLVRVRTPDQAFGIRNAAMGAGGVRVEYDAFSGTRRRATNP